jgi:tricorn protease
MLDDAATRYDIDFIIGEMLGELNASHTYHGVEPTERAKHVAVGYHCVNWQAD